jgi:hypothetical protein
LFVVGAQANLLERSPIGPKPVSCDLGESETLLLEQLALELPNGGFVAPVLDQDVQPYPHRQPSATGSCACRQSATTSSKCQSRLDFGTEPSKVPGDRCPKLQHPLGNCFVRDVETTLGEQILHVPIAEREPKIKPDHVLDDGGRKLVVGYEIGCIRAGYRHWQRNATIAMTMPFEMTESLFVEVRR